MEKRTFKIYRYDPDKDTKPYMETVEIELDGDPRARERPMAAVVSALSDLGVDLDAAPGGRLPLRIRGAGAVRGGTVQIDASASSQFVSALLLAAAAVLGEPLGLREAAAIALTLGGVAMALRR